MSTMTDDPVLIAERATLGALVSAPEMVKLVPGLSADHFVSQAHGCIFDAVIEAAHGAAVPDHLTVLDVLRRREDLVRIGGAPYLHTLVECCVTPVNLPYYARMVAEAATRRRVEQIATRMVQVAHGPDLDEVLSLVSEMNLAVEQAVVEPDSDEILSRLITAEATVARPRTEAQFVIPGILGRGERVVVVASEGAGKTYLGFQVGACVSQGRHPFNPAVQIEPLRVLTFDLENPNEYVDSTVRMLHAAAVSQFGGWRDGGWHLFQMPEGIDLRSPRQVASLERVVEKVRPHLVFFGPLYKAYRIAAGEPWETAAAEAAATLDRLRAEHGFALWMEHHAPKEQGGHRSLTPIGSGLWSRWPEFGLSLYKTKDRPTSLDVRRFRGDRIKRAWPDRLDRGGMWPWTPVWDDAMPDFGASS